MAQQNDSAPSEHFWNITAAKTASRISGPQTVIGNKGPESIDHHRMYKVLAIRDQIKNGTYRICSQQLAEVLEKKIDWSRVPDSCDLVTRDASKLSLVS